jgi:DNA invertase Pin-like site-specific DNA recombinase
MIRERTSAGLAAARAEGRVGGRKRVECGHRTAWLISANPVR